VPPHTAPSDALIGGGSNSRPGEISLAHQRILFLDEFPEFDRRVLEALREPLESGHIHLSRAARQTEFPVRFQLVVAMNPCPCGYLGDASSRCTCTAEQMAHYRARISGPLLDRIDMHVEVPRVSVDHLNAPVADGVETSHQVRTRVELARERQFSRAGKPNQLLTPSEIDRTCPLGKNARRLMDQALQQLGLSARAYHRVLKVVRTIADLAACDRIETPHLGER